MNAGDILNSDIISDEIVMGILKNPKEELFAQAFVQTNSSSDAYRKAYNAENMAATSIHVEATRVKKRPSVSLRIKELQEEIKMQHNITVESLLQELEEARTVALTCETPQTSAAVSATMGKAKLTGLDKQVIELRGNMMIETRSIASIFEGDPPEDAEDAEDAEEEGED